jgi:DNA-binding beta-propeller fold protein YncE
MGLVKKLSLALFSAGVMVAATAAQAMAVSLEFDSQIGSPGFAPGELFVPQGITVDDQTGNVLVSNGRGLNPDRSFNPALGNRVDVFSPDGAYLRSISSGRQGRGEGLDEPADLKFSPTNGNLYVGDVFNSEIDVYDRQGNFVKSFAQFGGPVPDRIFFGPGGLSFSQNGNLYVTDFSNDFIQVYDQNDNLVKTIGSNGTGPGQFVGPAGISVSPVSGNLFVADQYNNRIQILSPDGEFISAFGGPGTGLGQFNQPIGVEVDEQENVYVADSINSRVQVFDRNGNFLTSFGEPARDASGAIVPPPSAGPIADPLDLTPGVFNWTAGAHYNDGKLYVGDFFQGRVQVLNVVKDGATGGATKVPEPASLLGLGLLAIGATTTTLRKKQQKTATALKA